MTTEDQTPEEQPEPVIQDPALVNESGAPLIESTPEEPEVPEGGLPGDQPVAETPAPILPPEEPESLAEKAYRERHVMPESTSPSDYVPNRPNIRAPEDVGAVEQPLEETVTSSEPPTVEGTDQTGASRG